MDAADLRVFEAVARLGGMNRAAGELNTVQSNVTQRIRLLEEELATPLFQRHSRGVALTPAGKRLLPYAARVAQLLAEARRAVKDDGTPSGPLQIGSLETTAALRLSPVLASYAAAYPAVDVVLTTGTSAELVELVLAHRLEGAFVCGPVQHPELAAEPVFAEELVLVTAPTQKSLDRVLARSDLKIVVLRAGCSYRQRLEEILARRGIVGLRRLEFGTIEGILGCAAAGLGVTLLPRALVESARRARRVAVHTLPTDEARVETVFIRRRDAFVSSALAAFLAFVPAQAAAAAE
ncbi:MAG TPA: LysR substrate-binding domain-containing protein [Stellaceae bacterium]|nr:LysR substrate-binding domain-containing protein [Stellaceae bacterium]